MELENNLYRIKLGVTKEFHIMSLNEKSPCELTQGLL